MVGVAGREVRRSPRGGTAGLEPRRITGDRRGRDRKFAGGRDKRERKAAWTGLRVPGSAEWGGKRREKQRALLRAPGCPARPPARSRQQLADCWNSAARERAPYIEPGSAAAAGRACRGRGQNADPAGVSRQRRPPARGRQAPSWPPIGRRQFFFLRGRGREASGRDRLLGRPRRRGELVPDGCCWVAAGR